MSTPFNLNALVRINSFENFNDKSTGQKKIQNSSLFVIFTKNFQMKPIREDEQLCRAVVESSCEDLMDSNHELIIQVTWNISFQLFDNNMLNENQVTLTAGLIKARQCLI